MKTLALLALLTVGASCENNSVYWRLMVKVDGGKDTVMTFYTDSYQANKELCEKNLLAVKKLNFKNKEFLFCVPDIAY